MTEPFTSAELDLPLHQHPLRFVCHRCHVSLNNCHCKNTIFEQAREDAWKRSQHPFGNLPDSAFEKRTP